MNIRKEVMEFAEAMEKELQSNDHKIGWKGCDSGFLINGVVKNAMSILNPIESRPDIKHNCKSCADIANFAMMLWDNNRNAKI